MADTAPSKVAREQTFFNWMDGRCRTPAAPLPIVVAVLFFGALQGSASPQSSVAHVAFEAVSIKPADAPKWLPPGLSVVTLRGRRFLADPVTVRGLIVRAFQLKEWQIAGGPAWIATEPFSLEATINGESPTSVLAAQLPALLRSVLEDRFTLRAHMEQRRLRVYALVRARNDGQLGPQLRASPIDCEAQRRERAAAISAGAPKPSSSDRPTCMSMSNAGWILASGMTMQGLADYLTGENGSRGSTDRIVVNRTALTGEFDFALRWSPTLGGDQSPQAPLSVPPQVPDWLRDALLSAPPSDGVSVFNALREQLGLKLEPRDESLDVLVIDQIERPSPN